MIVHITGISSFRVRPGTCIFQKKSGRSYGYAFLFGLKQKSIIFLRGTFKSEIIYRIVFLVQYSHRLNFLCAGWLLLDLLYIPRRLRI